MHKEIRNTLAYIVVASFVMVTAVWQAQVQVGAAKDLEARHRALPPPPKTKHAVRPVPQPFAGDVVADYIARCEVGMSDREIGWIIEDFLTAGLDLGIRVAPMEDYLAQRKAQDRWYHDTLVEAWSLTPEQSAQVIAKLAELFQQAKGDFIEALASGPRSLEHDGKWYRVTSVEPMHRLINANPRLQDAKGRFLPWSLCKMAPEQDPNQASKEIQIKIINVPDEERYENVEITKLIQIAPAEPSLLTVDLVLPKQSPPPGAEPAQAALPKGGILPSLRKLHPAQLKLLLLIDPAKAKDIQQALHAESR